MTRRIPTRRFCSLDCGRVLHRCTDTSRYKGRSMTSCVCALAPGAARRNCSRCVSVIITTVWKGMSYTKDRKGIVDLKHAQRKSDSMCPFDRDPRLLPISQGRAHTLCSCHVLIPGCRTRYGTQTILCSYTHLHLFLGKTHAARLGHPCLRPCYHAPAVVWNREVYQAACGSARLIDDVRSAASTTKRSTSGDPGISAATSGRM